MRYEVSITGTRALGVQIDDASARELEVFLSALPTTHRGTVSRPIAVWTGTVRSIVDVHISRAADGEWQLRLGEQRLAEDAPDVPESVDPRLADLSTMVWVTDSDRLARWFNGAWLEFVGADLESELGWGWMRHVATDDLLGLLEAYESAQRECRGFEHACRASDRDGRVWWMQIRAVPRVVDGQFAGFVGMCEPAGEAELRSPPRPAGVAELLPPDLFATSEAEAVDRLARLEVALEVSRPADSIEAGFLRRLASRWASQHGALQARQDDIVLAVNEAAANSMVHAYDGKTGRVRLTCELQESHAEFRIRDWGVWQPPTSTRDSRGIALMSTLADELRIEHGPDGTEVVLRYQM